MEMQIEAKSQTFPLLRWNSSKKEIAFVAGLKLGFTRLVKLHLSYLACHGHLPNLSFNIIFIVPICAETSN